ncbi:translation initiation factor eIF 4e-like domain-containing protein [Lentinula raphanica]|uniref:Translation initiation factor eIF 4e-like domain-containing protein n=1 Tax=Lentinula raphanica TaxID=153919 RepID=A0AA38NX94_9AGAR|nr:translation initiation factor eIF 4e-like domain-containing protein [Lentinula raphanica]
MNMEPRIDSDTIASNLIEQMNQLRLTEGAGTMQEHASSQSSGNQQKGHLQIQRNHRGQILPNGLEPPSCIPFIRNDHGWVTCVLNDETSTISNIESFISHWRPSLIGPNNLVPEGCPWIAINRGNRHTPDSGPPRIAELEAAFMSLSQSHRTNGNITLTVSALDQLACQFNVRSGKWMIFADLNTVDSLWANVVRMVCIHRQRGFAKVAADSQKSDRVICVYVDDFTDVKEVMGLRQDLRRIGVEWKIKFKMDAYTYMGIYQSNSWGISPSRYVE